MLDADHDRGDLIEHAGYLASLRKSEMKFRKRTKPSLSACPGKGGSIIEIRALR